ncbi:MAG TPA: MoaD/ThiS family protein [Nakamurella sp.]
MNDATDPGSSSAGPAPTVQVRIPTILRAYTGGATVVSASGATIGDVIGSLEAAHPGIRARVLDEQGSVRRFVNLYLDDDDIRFGLGLQTPVTTGATVSIIPAVAGG